MERDMSVSQVAVDVPRAFQVPPPAPGLAPGAHVLETFVEQSRWAAHDSALVLVWCAPLSPAEALALARARSRGVRPARTRWLIDIEYAASRIASLEVSRGEAAYHRFGPHAAGRLRRDAFAFRVREPHASTFPGRAALWLTLRPSTDAELAANLLFPSESPPETLQLDVGSLASLRGVLLR